MLLGLLAIGMRAAVVMDALTAVVVVEVDINMLPGVVKDVTSTVAVIVLGFTVPASLEVLLIVC